MKDCQAPFNICNMTYEELQDHFEQAEVAKKDRCHQGKRTEGGGFSRRSSVNAHPLKLQNRFKELNIYDTSENIATGSTDVSTMEGASSSKKCGVDKQSACLIPHSRLLKTIQKFIIALRFIRGCKCFQHYFVRTLQPKQELMVKVDLKTLDTQRQMDEDAER